MSQEKSSKNQAFNAKQVSAINEFHFEVKKIWQQDFRILSSEEELYYTHENRCVRFLIAKEFKIPVALNLWKDWVNWRVTTKPENIMPKDVPNEIETRKAIWFGKDKQSHPCLVVKISRTNPKVDPQEMVKFGLYLLEKGIKEADVEGSGHIVGIIDLSGLSHKLISSKMTPILKELIQIIQSYYPERLHKLYLVKPNWIFRLLFTILKPFIDPKTRSKITMVTSIEDLKKDFTGDNLLKEYGGVSNIDDFIIDENNKYLQEDQATIINETSPFSKLDSSDLMSTASLPKPEKVNRQYNSDSALVLNLKVKKELTDEWNSLPTVPDERIDDFRLNEIKVKAFF